MKYYWSLQYDNRGHVVHWIELTTTLINEHKLWHRYVTITLLSITGCEDEIMSKNLTLVIPSRLPVVLLPHQVLMFDFDV